MNLNDNDHIVCVNAECRAEFLVMKAPLDRKSTPFCACGSPLKKVYRSPQFRVLDESERLQVEGAFALKRTGRH